VRNPLVPVRSNDPEIMDRDDNTAEDLRPALRDLASINRWLGGRRALRRALRPFLDEPGSEPLRVLDIGTGGADLPLDTVSLGRRSGRAVHVTALDLDPVTASIANETTRTVDEIRVVRGDAFRPPFPPGSFHVVTASLFLHHFTHAEIVRLMTRLRRLATQAVIVNDLRRHRLPWGFIHLASRAARLHPMVVHDGPLSVLRGFTDEELRAAAREAGSADAVVRRSWPFRLLMTVPGAAS
jgi:SAM-dependent methyltransferase